MAVLQPSYFPWLGVFDQMNRVDAFVFYDDVAYDKNGWRNRNRIKTSSGPSSPRCGPLWLTVPVLTHGRLGQLIKDVEIDPSQPWRRKHLGSLRQAYASAPFFEKVFPIVEEIISRDWRFLVDLNLAAAEAVRGLMGIGTKVFRSSELKIEGDRLERLIRICEHFGADEYLTGDAARSYMDEEAFRSRGISVVYQEYHHPEYPQLHGPFLSHLSVVDLLFNCGPESLSILAGRATIARAG